MQATEILATLQQRGATVRTIEGDQLEVVPRRVLDDELRKAIRAHKAEVLAELRRDEASRFIADPIVETRQELGAVLIESTRFGQLWVVLDSRLSDGLRNEEALRPTPRPVLKSSDIEAFCGKSEAMIRATLIALVVFPGSELIQ